MAQGVKEITPELEEIMWVEARKALMRVKCLTTSYKKFLPETYYKLVMDYVTEGLLENERQNK